MDIVSVTSEPPAKQNGKKQRKVSAAGRKAISDAAKARWKARKTVGSAHLSEVVSYKEPPVLLPTSPPAPSPSVLKLQEQVVELVSQRHQARVMLDDTHNAFLAAQGRFQAAESALKGIEQEVQYRIALIAQLENRTPFVNPALAGTGWSSTTPVLQMPTVSGNITSDASTQAQSNPARLSYAVAMADDLRRDLRGMM